MVTDIQKTISLQKNTIRTILISAILLWGLITPYILIAAKQYPELDYKNNIGFIRDVPEELRRELPICDEFLDVKWIREMPDRKNWVGRVMVDIKKDGKKERRELAVVEDSSGILREGRFNIIDITETKYRGSQFDTLVLSADHVSNLYPREDDETLAWGLSVIHSGQRIVLTEDFIGAQYYLDRGFTSIWTQHSDKRICIVHPDKKRWVFRKK